MHMNIQCFITYTKILSHSPILLVRYGKGLGVFIGQYTSVP